MADLLHRSRAGLALVAGIACLASEPAAADVFEIGGDGAVHVASPAAGVEKIPATTQEGADAAVIGSFDDDGPMPDVPATAVTQVSGSEVPDAYRGALDAAAAKARISPDLLAALVWQESRWHPAAVSAKGATGLTQLMPATAAALSVDPHDPEANLAGGAAYLRRMLDQFGGDVERALAAYNAGPARVVKAGGVPAIAETRAYVAAILARLGGSGAALAGVTKP